MGASWKPPGAVWRQLARRANRHAAFHPQTRPHTLPAVEVAGVTAFLYVGRLDDGRRGVCLSLDLDTAEMWLQRRDTVPVQIQVNGTTVFTDKKVSPLLAGHVLTTLTRAGAIAIRLWPETLEISSTVPGGTQMTVSGRFSRAQAARALGVPAACITPGAPTPAATP